MTREPETKLRAMSQPKWYAWLAVLAFAIAFVIDAARCGRDVELGTVPPADGALDADAGAGS
jgi:hypothetical protein